MYQFFETIRYENGQLFLLELHQKRIARTFELIYGTKPFFDVRELTFEMPKDVCLHRCRISYNQTSFSVAFYVYQKMHPKVISFYNAGDYTYTVKAEDRGFINNAVTYSKTDDVIFLKNGFLTDSSYANLAFYDGQNWYTPTTCLLNGVKRQYLLANKKLKEIPIQVADLTHFTQIALINAMRDLADSYDFDLIDGKLILN